MATNTTALTLRGGLQTYFDQIAQIPVLSREEEFELATQWYETRDRDVGQRLVVSNLRFVVKIAREYSKYGFRMADLVQEGNLGLLHAIDRFDPRKGFRLITYAVWWIRAYIQAFILRSWSMVRVGTTRIQRRVFSGLQKARRKIAAMGGDAPQTKQLAQELEIPEDELRETVQRLEKRDVSLDQPVYEDGPQSLGDTMADDAIDVESRVISQDIQEKVRETLDDVYDELKPRERYLLENRLLSDSPATLEAVGKEFGVTRERVRQIEESLKKKLKKHLAPALAA